MVSKTGTDPPAVNRGCKKVDDGLRPMQSFMGSQCRCCLKLNERSKSLLSHLQLAAVVHGQGSRDKWLGVILRERKHPPETQPLLALDVLSK